jgi:hypothetical protein
MRIVDYIKVGNKFHILNKTNIWEGGDPSKTFNNISSKLYKNCKLGLSESIQMILSLIHWEDHGKTYLGL